VKAPAALIALLLCAAVAGCGGSAGDGSSAEVAGGEPGGVVEFETRGADNSIQESGVEASAAERDQAAAALHGYLEAGVRRDWEEACRHLATPTHEQIALGIGLEGEDCRLVLDAFFAEVSRQRFAAAAVATVGSFRVEGERGFLLYHGAEGVDYSMPMVRERGQWRVAAAAGSALL